MPALTFRDGTDDKISCGNVLGASPTVFTLLGLAFVLGTNTNRRLISKQDVGGTTGFINFGLPGSVVYSQMQLNVDYVTTDAAARSNSAAWASNTWHFFGAVFDGVAAPNLFIGSLTSIIQNISATVGYAVQTAPAGARVTDNSGSLIIGNDVNLVRGFPGDIAGVWTWNRVLSLDELRQFQERIVLDLDYRDLLGGCAGLWLPGEYPPIGAVNVPDLSGRGFHGTVGGSVALSLTPVPVRPIFLRAPFGPPIWQSYKAPAGGGNVTVTPGAIALSMSMPAPTPRIRTLPGAIALSAAVPAPTPRVRTLPGVVGLTTALPAPAPRLRTLPAAIALVTSLLAPALRVRVHPSAVSNAAQFTYAAGDFLSHPDDATLSGGAGSMTIAFDAWLDASPPADFMWLVSKWDHVAAQREYGLRWDNTTGLLDFRVTPDGVNVTAISASSFGVIPTGQWIAGLAWYDSGGGTLNIQINNGPVDSSAYASGIFDGTSRFQISGIPFGQGWNGRQQHVRRWNRVLSAAERTEHFNGGLTLPYADLSAGLKSGMLNAWDLDEPSDGTVAVPRRDALGTDDLTDNLTVPSAVGKTVYHPIALGLSFPPPTPRVRALPPVVALTRAVPAPTPRVRTLPGAIALLMAVQTPAPRVRPLPAAIALTTALSATSHPRTARPPAVVLTTAFPAARPLVRPQTLGAVGLGIASLAPRSSPRARPATIALAQAIPAPSVRVTPHPSTIALSLMEFAPNVQAGAGATAHPGAVALAVSAPGPSLRDVVHLSTVGLAVSTLAPQPLVRPLPAVVGLSSASLVPRASIHPRPSVIALSLAVIAPRPVLNSHPSVVALALQAQAPKPLVRPKPTAIALVLSVKTASVNVTGGAIIATPAAIALLLAMQAPQPLVRPQPLVVALTMAALADRASVRPRPSTVQATLATFAPAVSKRALPSVVAVPITLPTVRPLVRPKPTLVGLVVLVKTAIGGEQSPVVFYPSPLQAVAGSTRTELFGAAGPTRTGTTSGRTRTGASYP